MEIISLDVLPDSMVKLREREIKWIVKQVVNGSITTRQTADIWCYNKEGVTIVKEYREKKRA